MLTTAPVLGLECTAGLAGSHPPALGGRVGWSRLGPTGPERLLVRVEVGGGGPKVAARRRKATLTSRRYLRPMHGYPTDFSVRQELLFSFTRGSQGPSTWDPRIRDWNREPTGVGRSSSLSSLPVRPVRCAIDGTNGDPGL